ncbi:PREDICTED: uncharacterized protein LOC106324172 [Brassica oleracea var. oleracea]|uniref:uncharacterized protein LOC106324172 n=1 Tax=Brassica oleracea var. oleracea TaxID=109376 RepID=UPI0006A6FFD0|nr:PREDICTED: uncharacterized protein LOC106324172 [Brassica oleracea var. oleracea]
MTEQEKSNENDCSEVEASEVQSRDENYSGSCDGCSLEKEQEDNENNDCSSNMEGEIHDVVREDEIGKENEEDDEFESRFDMFYDSNGASSEDDNFSSYGESPTENEDSPTLPPKKRYQNFSMSGPKGNLEVLQLEMSSIDLAVGQRYESKDDLERRLKLLTVRYRFDFDVETSTPTSYVVKCWVDGCLWRVRAFTQGESPTFYVRIYDSNHTCPCTERSNRSRQATPDILGELYKNFLGDVGPAVRLTSVGIAITKQCGVKMDYWKSHQTLKFAREIDEGTPMCGFESLPSYLYMIRRANPSTVTRLHIDELGRFMYVFLAFGASVNGFPFMRKVVAVNGTFLNGKYKGTLLTALAHDGNFQIFPIAFAVVDTENGFSWHWFFTQLKLLIPDDEGLAIISDWHNSIGKAIRNVYPLTARGICTYHLYKNILGRYKGKDVFCLVKKAARCFRMSDFTTIFEEIEVVTSALHGYLQRADVRLWTRVHFPGERYNLMTTNIVESMNRALSNARGLNIVRILESIRVMMTRWLAERREDARLQPTTLTRGVEKLLHGRVTACRDLMVQRIDDHHTEVKYGSSGKYFNVVNLEERKCTCRRFDREKLPCVHAIAAAEYNNVCRISLCSPYYNSAYLVSAYAESARPADSAQPVPEIVANQPCLPPYIRKQPGRPKKNRMKSALEVALQNKRPRKEHTWSRCKQSGHNTKTCPM